MRIYVAACLEEYQRARTMMNALKRLDHEITLDWTTEVEIYPGDVMSDADKRRHALSDLRGVRTADLVIVLTQENKAKQCGSWIELGAALALGIPVFIVGPQRDRSIFCALCQRFKTDEVLLAAIVEYALEDAS